MRCIKRFSFVIGAVLVLASCQKEHSLESGGKLDSLAKDCTIEQLIQSDSASGITNYAYVSVYDTAHAVSEIRAVDSLRNTIDEIFPITRTINRVQVNAFEYFLKGTDGKVTEFHGYENFFDSSYEKIVAKYTYNAAGLLVKRTVEFDSIPGFTVYQVDYTYAGNNLIRSDAKINLGSTLQSFASVAYEYDGSKTIKNFLYFQAFADEIFTYQTAVNFGAGATNPVSKTTFIYPNVLNNNLPKTNISRYINYTIDANNYVKSFYVTGDSFFILNLYNKFKYTLKYHCK